MRVWRRRSIASASITTRKSRKKSCSRAGTEVDEDGWAILDGDMVLDGPYIVCLMDGGTRRILEGSMSGDCSTAAPLIMPI